MFKNMKISLRFVLSFGLVLVFLISIILVSFNQIRVSSEKLSRIVKVNNVRIQLANNMIDDARQTSISIRNIILAKYQDQASGNIQKMLDELAATRKTYYQADYKLDSLFPKDDIKGLAILRRVNASADTAQRFQDKAVEFALEGKPNEANDFVFMEAYPSVKRWIKNIEDLINYNETYNALRYEQAHKAQASARSLIIILGISATVLSLMIAIFLTLSITKPLKIATTLVTKRDLTMDISAYKQGGGELGLMIQAFSKDIAERMRLETELITYRDQLEDMVRQRTADLSNVLLEVKETVNVIASSSTQIMEAISQVAASSAESASAISETTTSVEEVQQAAKLSAQKANNVAESAHRVVKVSQDGQKAVEEAVKGMNLIREQMDLIALTIVRLSEQSQSIGGIIASVTDIADQSNLLAVNAAIEAAKAGEHGRGFAVVAQEIRILANQSKQSTLQVRNILNDVQKATSAAVMAIEQGTKVVDAGVKQSAQAGEAILVLAESSREAVQVATQIVASSQQQVIGMDQIGMAMQSINQAGKEAAMSMRQSGQAAKSLQELGQKLKEVVERFKD